MGSVIFAGGHAPRLCLSSEPDRVRVSSAAFAILPLASDQDRADFTCGFEPLDRHVRQQASQDAKPRVANCFVARAIATGVIAGYTTLSATNVLLAELPTLATRATVACRCPIRVPDVFADRAGATPCARRNENLVQPTCAGITSRQFLKRSLICCLLCAPEESGECSLRRALSVVGCRASQFSA